MFPIKKKKKIRNPPQKAVKQPNKEPQSLNLLRKITEIWYKQIT